MLRLRFCRWLLFATLMLGIAVARGESYQAQDQSLHTVFTALSVPLGVPIVVSAEVARKRLSAVLDFDAPQQTLEMLAEQQALIWYGDGQVLYVYDASEAKSSAVALRHISIDKLRALMRRSGLDESRYPLRESAGRTFYVSGPPNYVDQVLRLAHLMDRQRADLRVGAQAFAVVQVLNTPSSRPPIWQQRQPGHGAGHGVYDRKTPGQREKGPVGRQEPGRDRLPGCQQPADQGQTGTGESDPETGGGAGPAKTSDRGLSMAGGRGP
jgi:type III secretion protein C